MGIERDIPSELKPFWKIFDKWCYRWDYATVFDDFLTMCIPNFSLSQRYADERDRVKEKYNEKEIQYFRECFFEMVRVYQDQLLQSQIELLLAPVLKLIKEGEDEKVLKKNLVKIFPQMDDKEIQQTLAKLIFINGIQARADEQLNDY